MVVKSPALSPSNWLWRYGEIGQIPALYIDAEELFQRMQEVMVPSLTSSQGSGGILLDLKWLPFSAAGRDALPFEASNPQFFMKTNTYHKPGRGHLFCSHLIETNSFILGMSQNHFSVSFPPSFPQKNKLLGDAGGFTHYRKGKDFPTFFEDRPIA